jgi:leucyl/phenylalanyl-tRNA---protein transferase
VSARLPVKWIDETMAFPPVEWALRSPNGLLAAGEDLSPRRVLEAYRQGIFPWYSEGQPVLWWSPDPRMVLFINEFKIHRSFRKTLAKIRLQNEIAVRCDTSFEQVMRACAQSRPGQDGTWINPDMLAVYCKLHASGVAHSIEVWQSDRLIGGLYGLAIGRMFFGESMFSRAPDASKLALAALVAMLREWDFELIDCQQNTSHLGSLGGREISRAEFIEHVDRLSPLAGADWKTANFANFWQTSP